MKKHKMKEMAKIAMQNKAFREHLNIAKTAHLNLAILGHAILERRDQCTWIF